MISNKQALREVKEKFSSEGVFELVKCKTVKLNGEGAYYVTLKESGTKLHNYQAPATIQDIWFNEVFK